MLENSNVNTDLVPLKWVKREWQLAAAGKQGGQQKTATKNFRTQTYFIGERPERDFQSMYCSEKRCQFLFQISESSKSLVAAAGLITLCCTSTQVIWKGRLCACSNTEIH